MLILSRTKPLKPLIKLYVVVPQPLLSKNSNRLNQSFSVTQTCRISYSIDSFERRLSLTQLLGRHPWPLA